MGPINPLQHQGYLQNASGTFVELQHKFKHLANKQTVKKELTVSGTASFHRQQGMTPISNKFLPFS